MLFSGNFQITFYRTVVFNFSRAHTIVAINFQQKGKNEATGQNTTKTSVINLVDLAGR